MHSYYPVTRQEKSGLCGTICFSAGILSMVLGAIASWYKSVTTVSGFLRSIDREYDKMVRQMYASADALEYLIFFGCVLIVVGIIIKYVSHNEGRGIQIITATIIFSGIILYSVINYIPIIQFYLNERV